MAFDAGAILGTLGMDISDYTRGMLQAQGIAQLFPSVVSNFLANPLLGFVDVAKKAAGTLLDMFRTATDEADNIGDLAASVGVGVEFLSGLGLVASQAGSNVAEVGDAFKFLGKNAAEAVAGGETARRAFSSLGISMSEVKSGMTDLPSLMLRVADGLAAMPEGATRTSVAMEILGRSGTNLIATLGQGSIEIGRQMDLFRRFGGTVSAESARSADAWNDAMGTIRIAYLGLRNVFAERFRDALLPYLQELTAWMEANPEVIKNKVRDLADDMVRNFLGIADSARFLIDNLKEAAQAAAALSGFASGARSGATIGAAFGPKGSLVGGIVGGVAGAAIAGGVAGSIFTPSNVIQTVNQFHVRVDAQHGVTQATAQFREKVDRALNQIRDRDLASNVGGNL